MTNKRLYNNPKYTTKRGNTFYINFRLPSGAFFRQSLGTDSLKAVEVTMSRLIPFIPLVQSGVMNVDDFKLRLNGMREMTRDGLNKLLLNVLEITIEDASFLHQTHDITREPNLLTSKPIMPRLWQKQCAVR